MLGGSIYTLKVCALPTVLHIGYTSSHEQIVSHVVTMYINRACIDWSVRDPTNIAEGRDTVCRSNYQWYTDLYARQSFPGDLGFETGHEDNLITTDGLTYLVKRTVQSMADFLCLPVGGLDRMMQPAISQGPDAALPPRTVPTEPSSPGLSPPAYAEPSKVWRHARPTSHGGCRCTRSAL